MDIPLFDKYFDIKVKNYNADARHLDSYPRGDWLDDEQFIKVAEGCLQWLDDNFERLVDNIISIYEATGYESGYSALSEDLEWNRRIVAEKPERAYSRERIEGSLAEKALSPLYHLYQNKAFGKRLKNERFGFTGSLITTSMNIEIEESDRRDTLEVIYSYHVSMNVGTSKRDFFEIPE